MYRVYSSSSSSNGSEPWTRFGRRLLDRRQRLGQADFGSEVIDNATSPITRLACATERLLMLRRYAAPAVVGSVKPVVWPLLGAVLCCCVCLMG